MLLGAEQSKKIEPAASDRAKEIVRRCCGRPTVDGKVPILRRTYVTEFGSLALACSHAVDDLQPRHATVAPRCVVLGLPRVPGRRGGCPLAPHRPGRAGFPHPVPHARDSFQLV